MARACNGDAAALRALYDLCAPELFARFASMTGDAALTRDIVHTAFIRLCQTRRAFVRGADPVPWLEAIARAEAGRRILIR